MGISSSMNAGVAGLNANANKLSTIADNVSNSQTAGYKRSDIDFAALTTVGSRTSYGGGAGRTFTAGGVTTTVVHNVENKGSIVGTNNATDIAIAGRGLLPVTNITSVNETASERELLLSSTGSFNLDAEGYLKTPSGLVLLGWAADDNGDIPAQPRETAAGLEPIKVNVSDTAAHATSSMVLNVNLPAYETQAGKTGETKTVNTAYIDNFGEPRTLSMAFTPTVPATGDPQSHTWTLEITDQVTGLSAGTYEIVFDSTEANAGNLSSVTQTSAGASPPSTTYDDATGELTLSLDQQTVAIQMGSTSSSGPHHLTELSSPFTSAGVTRDGNQAGVFTNLSINDKGLVSANYSSGFSRVLYQVPIADVPNMNGLQPRDGQTFTVSNESGGVFFYDAGAGPTGNIQAFAIEQSTTDTATELTQLIQTQRAYSSNAKIIQTVDEMMQEITNLKR